MLMKTRFACPLPKDRQVLSMLHASSPATEAYNGFFPTRLHGESSVHRLLYLHSFFRLSKALYLEYNTQNFSPSRKRSVLPLSSLIGPYGKHDGLSTLHLTAQEKDLISCSDPHGLTDATGTTFTLLHCQIGSTLMQALPLSTIVFIFPFQNRLTGTFLSK